MDTELQHMLTVAAQPEAGRAGTMLRDSQAAALIAPRRAELPAAGSEQLLNQHAGRDYGARTRQLHAVERFRTPVSVLVGSTACLCADHCSRDCVRFASCSKSKAVAMYNLNAGMLMSCSVPR